MTDMTEVQVVMVDAATAREWLAKNEANRNISWPVVYKYATDMANERWMLSTDCIGFDMTGRLIQGQHRLHAVIYADEQLRPGLKVPMLVAHGFPPSTFDVLDQGKIRGAAQVLATHGVTNTTVTAAVARQALYYDRFPNLVWKGSEAVSRVEVIEYAVEHREELHAAGTGSHKMPFLNHVSYVLLHYLVNRDSDHEDKWDEWHGGIYTGENLPPGDPRLRMRSGFTPSKWGMAGAQPRLGAYIKMWNAFVNGDKVQLMIYRRNELPMPKVL